MNIKLTFGAISDAPVDLLAVVLDPDRRLHAATDPVLRSHLERAEAGFRDKTQKREYIATASEGAPYRCLIVFWNPSQKSFNLWENLKTFTARAVRGRCEHRNGENQGRPDHRGLHRVSPLG